MGALQEQRDWRRWPETCSPGSGRRVYRVDREQQLDELVSHAVALLRAEVTAPYSRVLTHLREVGASDEEADAAVRRGLTTGRILRVGISGLLHAP